jgi:LytB protein
VTERQRGAQIDSRLQTAFPCICRRCCRRPPRRIRPVPADPTHGTCFLSVQRENRTKRRVAFRRTLQIESADELEPARLQEVETVGLASGLSTPREVVEAVQARLLAECGAMLGETR